MDKLAVIAKYFDCTTDYLLRISEYRDTKTRERINSSISDIESAFECLFIKNDALAQQMMSFLITLVDVCEYLHDYTFNDLSKTIEYLEDILKMANMSFNMFDLEKEEDVIMYYQRHRYLLQRTVFRCIDSLSAVEGFVAVNDDAILEEILGSSVAVKDAIRKADDFMKLDIDKSPKEKKVL